MANIQSDKMQWDLLIKDSEAQRNIANLSKANKDLEKSNKEIRLEMARLEAQGKKNSEEWKGLQDVMKKNNAEISNNTQLIKANENLLGTQSMTMNQLKKRYQELLKEMNNTSKATDPKAWESLKSQLDETKGAMSNLAGGTQKAEGVMISWGSAMKIGVAGIIAGIGQKIASLIGDFFSLEKIINSNQKTGDKFQAAISGISNSMDVLRRAIATLDFSELSKKMEKAYKSGVMIAKLLDEVFELENSFKIKQVKVNEEIELLREQGSNVNLSEKERIAYLEKVLSLTNDLAESEKTVVENKLKAANQKLYDDTGLTEVQVEYVVSNYLINRSTIQAASELIKMEDNLKAMASKSVSIPVNPLLSAPKTTYDQVEYNAQQKRIEYFKQENEQIVKAADALRKYNLTNDATIISWVNANVELKQISVNKERSEREIENQKNSLLKATKDKAVADQKELAAKTIEEREKMYKIEIDAADKAHNIELLGIKDLYLSQHIEQEEYNIRSESLEQDLIAKKIEINTKYSKSVDELQNNLLDRQIDRMGKLKSMIDKITKDIDDKLKKQIEESDKKTSSGLNSEIEESLSFMSKAAETATKVIDVQKEKLTKQKELYDADLLALTDSLELKMLTQQQYEQAVDKLNKDSWKERFEINSEGAKKVTAIILEGLNIASQVSSQLQEIETTRLETQKNKELALYGNSSEKRAEIEQEFEEKKLKIQQKYADIDMGIKIAQALASGAQGAMTAIAQLGTFAGPAVAVIAGMTALQVATIVAQRNAIKSRSGVSSGGSSGGSAERTLIGSSQQQSTSQIQIPRAQQPKVGNGINEINNMQEQIKNKERAALGELKPLIGILDKVSGLLESLHDNPISANVVLSEFEAKTKQRDRIKKEGSL